MIVSITREAELVLRLCRPRPTAAQVGRAEELLTGELDWGRVIDHAARHRVLPATWAHVARLGRSSVPQMHRELARAAVLYTGRRAEALQSEFRILRAAFDKYGVPTMVRKGIVLGSAVYPSPSWRYMTDLDFFIRREDVGQAKRVLYDLGYLQGAVSSDHRTVTPMKRKVEAFWLLNASSLPAFRRPTSDPSIQVFSVDLRHNILEPAVGRQIDMDDWFMRSRLEWLLGDRTRLPSREDFVVDLCVHLYREAVTLTAVEAGKDLTLGKFVDVAEVLASPVVAPDQDVLIERVRGYALNREVYYTLRHTETLLPGSVSRTLLEALHPGDDEYLDAYGVIDGQPGQWRDPIIVRAFDYDRRRRIPQRSKLIRAE